MGNKKTTWAEVAEASKNKAAVPTSTTEAPVGAYMVEVGNGQGSGGLDDLTLSIPGVSPSELPMVRARVAALRGYVAEGPWEFEGKSWVKVAWQVKKEDVRYVPPSLRAAVRVSTSTDAGGSVNVKGLSPTFGAKRPPVVIAHVRDKKAGVVALLLAEVDPHHESGIVIRWSGLTCLAGDTTEESVRKVYGDSAAVFLLSRLFAEGRLKAWELPYEFPREGVSIQLTKLGLTHLEAWARLGYLCGECGKGMHFDTQTCPYCDDGKKRVTREEKRARKLKERDGRVDAIVEGWYPDMRKAAPSTPSTPKAKPAPVRVAWRLTLPRRTVATVPQNTPQTRGATPRGRSTVGAGGGIVF